MVSSKDNDKERILREIIVSLDRAEHLTCTKKMVETVIGPQLVKVDYHDKPVAQFVSLGIGKPKNIHPVPEGSIIKCLTNPNHDWGISRFVEAKPDYFVLREIGSKRTLRMYNETFDILIGVPLFVLSEGWERKMYLWGERALSERWNKHANHFTTRCAGVGLNNNILTIKVRPHAFTLARKKYKNRTFNIPVSKKTRLKDIVQHLCDANFNAEWTDDELLTEKRV